MNEPNLNPHCFDDVCKRCNDITTSERGFVAASLIIGIIVLIIL